MKKPEYFRTYIDAIINMRGLNDEQAGKLFKAKCEYADSFTEPDFSDDPVLRFIWPYEKARMDKDFKSFYVSCVWGMYGAYCKTCETGSPMTPSDWVAWQKDPVNKTYLKHPVFNHVEPEDFLSQKPQKNKSADFHDSYDFSDV